MSQQTNALRSETLTTNPEFSYYGLFNRFAQHPYGEYQATQSMRFSGLYAYDQQEMLHDLGDDVRPLYHMPHTERTIFRNVAGLQPDRFEQLTEEETVIGRLSAFLHDIGECEHPDLIKACGSVIGDISYGQHTEADKAQEATIRNYLYRSLYSDLPSELLEKVEDTVAHTSGTLLREAFATTERIGYFTTGINAGRIALGLKAMAKSNEDHLSLATDERFRALRKLGVTVTANWYEELHRRGEVFEYAGTIASRFTADYDRIQKEFYSEQETI